MIAISYDGWDPAGLVRYLLGPGRYEEHINPRVIAGSRPPELLDPRPVTVMDGAPESVGLKAFDPAGLQALYTYLETGVREAGLPLRTPGPDSLFAGREGYVWHTPVRLAPEDPILDDQTWARIAHRLMRATGIDQAGCRWVAIRHGEDHIHLAAVLVHWRDGQWRRFYPGLWKRRLREEVRRIEREMGLRETADADRTATPALTKGEWRRAKRTGAEPARVWLRRRVSQLAATVTGAAEFDAGLRREGIMVRYRYDKQGDTVGYSVAAPWQASATGMVLYSGAKLAPELTWPKLLQRWTTTPSVETVPRQHHDRVSPQDRQAVLDEATRIVEDAAATIRAEPAHGAAIGWAAGEMLHAMARTAEFPAIGGFTAAAEQLGPATRTPHQVLPDRLALAGVSRHLRGLARRLASINAFPPPGRGSSATAQAQFTLALASLLAEIGAWYQNRDRAPQARAACQGTASLRRTPSRGSPATPMAVESQGHAPVSQRASRGPQPGTQWPRAPRRS
ncbi:relaxase/mobilization nuclease domain-containing protein [Sciscionella marina]|uniref:relaxase/mobilization nuclease domain-containing protein n=1 Tax=Sciscionella marina TaxID=508770 RepID=UPI0003766421|nr:hypothetical protein [Sciscionella marina]